LDLHPPLPADFFSIFFPRKRLHLGSVDVFIEDRLSQKGPFRVNVRPDTTLGQLKGLMETRHQIDVKIQRWIIERRLATDEQQTLQQYGLSAENSSAFLYLVAPGEFPNQFSVFNFYLRNYLSD